MGNVWQDTLALAVVAATPLLWASLGELISGKVGVGNWGIEGVMLIGAVTGVIVAYKSDSAVLGLLGGAAGGSVYTIVFYAVPVLLLRASPLLVAFACWFIGIGLSSEIGKSYENVPLEATVNKVGIPGLEKIPFIGPIFFDQLWPAYVGVVLVVITALVLRRTRHGLNMRALGEDPGAAYASGIAVLRWRAFYVALGGAFIGAGGAILSVGVVGGWQSNMTAGRGWIALALVIFVGWRPLALLWATFLFGFLLALGNLGQAQGWPIPAEFLQMAPYVVTIVALAGRTLSERWRGGGSTSPAALGADFVRGQR